LGRTAQEYFNYQFIKLKKLLNKRGETLFFVFITIKFLDLTFPSVADFSMVANARKLDISLEITEKVNFAV